MVTDALQCIIITNNGCISTNVILHAYTTRWRKKEIYAQIITQAPLVIIATPYCMSKSVLAKFAAVQQNIIKW